MDESLKKHEPAGAAVIVNADDWGRDSHTTDCILECFEHAKISSVSAMVFMEDSERAASIARARGVDAGLHLNLITPFSARGVQRKLREHQAKVASFLGFNNLARVLFQPSLAASFDYVVKAQLDEFARLWQSPAQRVDGHHHMHLCANVLMQKLLPAGIIVRRNFSFAAGEKGFANRLYRRWQDRNLARRYRIADYFFSLRPIDPKNLSKICGLSSRFDVEVAAHPVVREEHDFFLNGELGFFFDSTAISRGYILRSGNSCSSSRGDA